MDGVLTGTGRIERHGPPSHLGGLLVLFLERLIVRVDTFLLDVVDLVALALHVARGPARAIPTSPITEHATHAGRRQTVCGRSACCRLVKDYAFLAEP